MGRRRRAGAGWAIGHCCCWRAVTAGRLLLLQLPLCAAAARCWACTRCGSRPAAGGAAAGRSRWTEAACWAAAVTATKKQQQSVSAGMRANRRRHGKQHDVRATNSGFPAPKCKLNSIAILSKSTSPAAAAAAADAGCMPGAACTYGIPCAAAMCAGMGPMAVGIICAGGAGQRAGVCRTYTAQHSVQRPCDFQVVAETPTQALACIHRGPTKHSFLSCTPAGTRWGMALPPPASFLA